jgi:hypothetical protein
LRPSRLPNDWHKQPTSTWTTRRVHDKKSTT